MILQQGDVILKKVDSIKGIKLGHLTLAEGVHPDCKTIGQALNWRNQSTETPIILT